MKYLKLPSGGTPARLWEDDQLGLEHGIKTFSAYPEKNLLAVLEEWFADLWVVCPNGPASYCIFSPLECLAPQRTLCQTTHQAIGFNPGHCSAS